MTVDNDGQELSDMVSMLKAEITELKSEIKTKKDNERSEVITEIATLAKVLDEDFDEKEFEGLPLANLFVFRKQYKKLVDLKEQTASSEANFVDRTKVSKFEGADNHDVFNKLVNVVSRMWNFPVTDAELNEDVRYQHRAEGLVY